MNLKSALTDRRHFGRIIVSFIPLACLLFLIFMPLNGQEYGLGFAGQPNSKDRRTQLDLSPDKYLSFKGEFELSFDIRIREDIPMTFGYIFRMVDINNNNVDLLFNGPKSYSLQVVYSDKLTGISVPYPDMAIYNKWTTISIKLDLKNHSIEFTTPDTILSESGIPLEGKVKIFFGRNNFDPVQTTDVPTMDVRDIRISKKGRSHLYYPLDELSGNIAHDRISGNKARVEHPMWIRPEYQQWKEHFSTLLHGFAATCYDPQEEKLYMVGDRQMKIFSVLADSIQTLAYRSAYSGLITGSQLIYDSISKQLICYSLKNRTVHYFNSSELQWELLSDGPDIPDRYWFHNKFYSAPESLLYAFGGYSQHKYYNLVLTYDLKSRRWDTIQAGEGIFHPRMHAALGVLEDTLYILGGYGSTSGDQELNPQHYDDLLSFSLDDHRFERIYDYKAPLKNIDFGHSMVIDPDKRSFYVLASSIYQYDSYLQLLKGSFDHPEMVSLGDRIPYLFHNENSYADLFYSEGTNHLLAVTSLANTEKNETEFNVRTISFPPFPAGQEETGTDKKRGYLLWTVIVLIILAPMVYYLTTLYRKRTVSSSGHSQYSLLQRRSTNKMKGRPVYNIKSKKPDNSIFFFGGFQVNNRDGEDITGKFSPLLKELFLLIFLFSIKDKGISVPHMTELLWFSMDARSAKNNRAVNIAKLKHLLSEIESCDLTRKTEYWQILFDDTIVYSDYATYKQLTNKGDALSKVDLENLLYILKPGPLLGNASYEWLDVFKLECSNQVTDVLVNYIEKNKASIETELMVRIADAILIFDIMHEEAIIIKCEALIALGKHSLAKEIFNKFTRDYQTLYDEPYSKSFTEILKH